MNWRNVFDAMKVHWGGGMTEAFDAARKAKYPYVSWNGWIYNAETGERMGFKTEDVR